MVVLLDLVMEISNMARYTIKESELRSTIKKVVEEEISHKINENFGNALKNAGLNTLKTAVKGIVAPSMLAQDAVKKIGDISMGNDTITGTISNFFGGNSSSAAGKTGGNKSKEERRRERSLAARDVAYEFGKPETVPGRGRRIKLEIKSEITVPPYDKKRKTGCTLYWGEFGEHYHDEGDRMWIKKITDTERTLIRVSHGDQNKLIRFQQKYKRALLDWLKERDRAYENYIKSIN